MWLRMERNALKLRLFYDRSGERGIEEAASAPDHTTSKQRVAGSSPAGIAKPSIVRQIEEGIRAGEGDAIIGANGSREALIEEEALEGGKGHVLAGSIEGLAHEQEA